MSFDARATETPSGYVLAPLATTRSRPPFIPIAIVGVGMRAPGGIDDLDSLWQTLEEQKSYHAPTFTDPLFHKRFDANDPSWQAMFNVTPDARETLHSSLLEETPALDEGFFGVSARESACMDVQQKLLLHVAHEALENAGYDGGASGSFNKEMFGVYIGASTDDFEMDPHSYEYDIYHLARNQRAFLAGQISHRFGFHGPAVAVDTVCASGITALNDACRALSTGECDAALAGGVHVMTPISAPPTVTSLKLAGFLDPTGQCKPFMARGKGYCRAEGCGLTVLKRLDDALRDGDRVLGVIRGVGVGNMAAPKSIHRPNGKLQSAILERALRMSGLSASDVTFVEAHGPGTQAGDPAELESITTVLGSNRDEDLVIGSVKGNIGHSEAASAMLSLFKVLAMMQRQTIPAQPNFSIADLSPKLRPFLDGQRIRIADHFETWKPGHKVAVVNNFGASGYAGSLIVESPPPTVSPSGAERISTEDVARLFVLSAKDLDTLMLLRQRYTKWLQEDGAKIRLRDLSFTMTTRRTVHNHTQLFSASSIEHLVEQLSKEDGRVIPNQSPRQQTIGYCFSGQGGPYQDPRKSSLYRLSSAYTKGVDQCYAISAAEQLVHEEDSALLDLFALQYGLSCAWKSWGYTPSVVSGHSFGEYGALVYAGVLSLRDALYLVGARAALVRKLCLDHPSCMAALKLASSEREQLLKAHPRIELACDNATDRVTLAGTREDLDALEVDIRARYPEARWQLVDNMKVAFHSRFVEPLLAEFRAECAKVQFSPPTISFISAALGRTCQPGDGSLTSEYLVAHCRNTVQFRRAMEGYHRHSDPDWIEVGPHATAISFIASHPVQLKVASHRKGHDGWSTMLSTLITLRSAGHKVDFVAFNRDTAPDATIVDLPRYPFRLIPHKYRSRKPYASSLLPAVPSTSKSITAEAIAAILEGHIVAGTSICPASIYMSLSLYAASSISGSKSKKAAAFTLSNLSMSSPFPHTRDNHLTAHASSSPAGGSSFSVQVTSKNAKLHASMNIHFEEDDAKLLSNLSLLAPILWKMNGLTALPETNVLDKRLAYALFGQTVVYGSHSQALDRVWIAENGREAWARSGNDPVEEGYEPSELKTYSPTLIDRACQLVGLLINTSPSRGEEEIFVASSIDSVEMSLRKLRSSSVLHSYASFELMDSKEGVVAVGQVYTFDANQQLLATFRGIRMRRMKREVVRYLTAQAVGGTAPPATVTPLAAVPLTIPIPASASSSTSTKPLLPAPVQAVTIDANQEVITLTETVLGVKNISNTLGARLSDLGLDSLTSIELQVKLERLFPGCKLEPGFLLQEDTTVQSVLNLLAQPTSSSAPSTSGSPSPLTGGMSGVLASIQPNPEVIQETREGIPLVLIHDGSGTALAYQALGPLKRTLLGIHNPGLGKHASILDVQTQADTYAGFIRHWLSRQPERGSKVLVGGWSLGGLIAIALAAAHPDLIAGVLLIDPPPPGTTPMQADEVDVLVPRTASRRDGELQELVREQLSLNSLALHRDSGWLHRVSQLLHSSRTRLPVYLISALEPLNHAVSLTSGTLKPPLEGSCSEWMLSPDRASMAERAWKALLGDRLIGSTSIVGDHFTMFTPQHMAITTSAILQGADTLQSSV